MMATQEDQHAIDIMVLIETIKNLTTETEVLAVARQGVRQLGGDHFIYTSFLGDHADPLQESCHFFIGCMPAWCQIYNARKWFETDPFVQYARAHNTAPVFGSEIVLQTPGQVEMIKTAGDFGFKSCLVIPAHTGSIRHMGMLYVGSSEEGAAGELKLARNRGYYRLIAAEMLDWWIRRIRQEAIEMYKLNDSEVMVLKLELEGLAAKEKAAELALPVTSIYSMYRKIKAKFAVDDVKDAARIAHVRGILS